MEWLLCVLYFLLLFFAFYLSLSLYTSSLTYNEHDDHLSVYRAPCVSGLILVEKLEIKRDK